MDIFNLNKNKNTEENAGGNDQVVPTGEVPTDGASLNPPAPEITTEDIVPKATPEAISQRLGDQSSTGKASEEQVAQPQNAIPFDFSKLTVDQIQTLKAMFESTPDKKKQVVRRPKIKVVEIDGRYVIGLHGRAFLKVVRDHDLNREVERHYIRVIFHDMKPNEQPFEMPYREFISADRVECEVVGQNHSKIPVVEGEVWSVERKRMVEMIREDVKHEYEIQLPDGEVVKIDGDFANL